jgi:hypothetical protein
MAVSDYRELIVIAERLQFIHQESQSEILKLTTEVGRLVSGLANSLKKKLT